MQIDRTFTITITSACETSTFTYPALQNVYKYTLDNNDRQILAIDLVRDDISNLAVKSFSRNPTAPAFCGGDNNEFYHSFTVVSFT
jgi:hypothetical protein